MQRLVAVINKHYKYMSDVVNEFPRQCTGSAASWVQGKSGNWKTKEGESADMELDYLRFPAAQTVFFPFLSLIFFCFQLILLSSHWIMPNNRNESCLSAFSRYEASRSPRGSIRGDSWARERLGLCLSITLVEWKPWNSERLWRTTYPLSRQSRPLATSRRNRECANWHFEIFLRHPPD